MLNVRLNDVVNKNRVEASLSRVPNVGEYIKVKNTHYQVTTVIHADRRTDATENKFDAFLNVEFIEVD